MLTRSVQLFLVSVAIIAMVPFAATQTVTLGFDGAPNGELPWSEQGFTFTTPVTPFDCQGAGTTYPGHAQVLTQDGSLELQNSAFQYASCTVLANLFKADGGTFDAVSLDVVNFAVGDEYGECLVERLEVSSTTASGEVTSVIVYEAGTVVLDWTDISSLTVSLSIVAGYNPPPFIAGCSGFALLDNFVVRTPHQPWTDLGDGLAGVSGVPTLVGGGDLTVGSVTTLNVAGAAPSAASYLILGLSDLSADFKGGVLVPSPDIVIGPFPTTAAGELALSAHWPPGVPSCTEAWWQMWVQDAAAVKSFSATNGLLSTAP